MREYLFRGFHPDENRSKTITLNGEKICGKWVEGGFCYEYNRGVPLICPRYDFSQEVIPETVGQWTGKVDKNSKKIFEGDIVQSEEYQQGDEVGEVVYDSKRCTYWVHSEKFDWWLMLDEGDWAIISNKWEVEK